MYGFVDTSEFFRIIKLYTASLQHFETDYFFKGEEHNFWEIVIVTEGKVGVTADKDVLTLGAGEAIIHEPMEFHRIWAEEKTKPIVVIFTFSAEGMPEYEGKIFKVSDILRPQLILSELYNSYHIENCNIVGIEKDKLSQSQTALKELEIFVLNLLAKNINKKESKSRTAENYTKIIECMSKNLNKTLSVADIALMCNMSEINLKKTFSRYSGMGVMEYFNKMKINQAVMMIQNGTSIKETAISFGFANQNYFSTVFKRVTGYSPKNYK